MEKTDAGRAKAWGGGGSIKAKPLPADGRLTWVTRIAYGSGDAACNVVYGMISTLLTIFYTDYVGVSLATVGIVMLISRIFDGTSDVIMGVVTEKTKSKWGKCRPWMLWMAVPYAITAVALFTVPQTSDSLQFWYIFVAYNLCTTVVYTAINVPYGALSTRMTRSSSERDMLSIVRLVLARCGQIITVMLTMPLVKLLGNDQAAWIKAIAIWSIMAVALLIFCFAKCEEKVQVEEVVKQAKVSLGRSIKALVTNQYFWATLVRYTGDRSHVLPAAAAPHGQKGACACGRGSGDPCPAGLYAQPGELWLGRCHDDPACDR